MKTLFHIFFIFLGNQLLSQDPYHLHLSKENGLPSNSIYNIFQDKKGFIWFSSNAGLTRYDGFDYKTYSSNDQTSKAGSSITEDKHGRVWYENFDGFIYYVEKDSLKTLKQNKPIGYVPFGINDKYLITFQEKGVDIYDINTLSFIRTVFIKTNSVEYAFSINNNFYMMIESTLYCLTENLNLFSSDFYKTKFLPSKQIYQASNGLYVLNKYNTNKQIQIFDKKLNLTKTITINEPSFIQGSSFIDSLIWIHTTNGTFAYSISRTSNTVEFSIFKNKSISCLLKDRQGNYWFGTTNEGVFVSPSLKNTVTHIKDILPNRIVELKNSYCIGTKKGELVLCDKNFNVTRVFKNPSDNSEIYFLAYDTLFNSFLYTSNVFTERSQNNNYTLTKTHHIALKDIIRVDSNYFAFAASGYCGLAKLNKTQSKSKWDSVFNSCINVNDKNTCALIENIRGKSVVYNKANNTLYFSTNVGFYKITPHQKREITHKGKSVYVVKTVAYKNKVYALDTKGLLLSIENDSVTAILNNTLGLDNNIKYIKGDENQLVIVTSEFAYLLNMDNYSLHKIDIDVTSYEIGDVLINKNTLLFVTNNGIIKTNVTEKNIKDNSEFVVTEFRVNSELKNKSFIHEFNYLQNDITIKYSILDFGSSHENKLYYKINESDWKLASPETRVIEFASLSPGNYIIEFKLNNNVLSEKITFNINAPFWKTIWFNVLLIALILLMVFVYYKWQLNKLRNKNKLLQEKINLENDLNKTVLKSIKAQMNPHFFYNALNTIQAYIFTNDKTKANTYLAKFSKLTRAILEMSEKETITLSEEIDSLKLYLELEKMRFKEGFTYQLNVLNIENTDLIELPPMIIQPYIENAIKHGLLHFEGNKELFVDFNLVSDALLVTIDDNGIGRKRSAELNKIKNHKYQSFSSEANEKRLEILNKGRHNTIAVEIIDKTDFHAVANGTKVILTIPIN